MGQLADELVALGFTAHWPLGETAGDALDAIGANDGSVTIGAGVRNAPALNVDGDGCISFDALLTLVQVTQAAAVNNIFDTGGSIFFMFNFASGGEGTGGEIIFKDGAGDGWTLRVNESAGNLKLRFFVGFDGDDGVWEQAAFAMPLNTTIAGVLVYDADADTNDPILYVWDGTRQIVQTIANGGLVEPFTPSGTRSSDVARDFFIGNDLSGFATVDGRVDEIAAAASVALTEGQAQRVIELALFAAVGGAPGGQVGGVGQMAGAAPHAFRTRMVGT